MIPVLFTHYETGEWIRWPRNLPFQPWWLELRSPDCVEMGPIRVHSLLFDPRYYAQPRWDCINGWTPWFTEDSERDFRVAKKSAWKRSASFKGDDPWKGGK